MSQLKQTASVTNGSQAVSLPGVNLAVYIKAGHVFMVDVLFVAYFIAADATFDGTNTNFSLTGAYLGVTNAAAPGIVCQDATQNNIPTLAHGDVGTAAVFTAAMYKIEALLTGATPVSGGGTGGTPIPNTDSLPEGLVNLYFTQARARAAVPTPIASPTVLGMIKVGANLTIDVNGVLAAPAPSGGGSGGIGTVTNVSGVAPIQVVNNTSTPSVSITPATIAAAGTMSAADFSKLQGVALNANNFTYALPIATTTALGGIKIGPGLTIDSTGLVSVTATAGGGTGSSAMIVSAIAPVNPTNGQQWLNMNDGVVYTWVIDTDSSQWVELGPTSGRMRDAATVCDWRAAGNSTSVTVNGNQAFSVVGTSTAASVASTTKQTWLRRIEYLQTVAGASNVAGFRAPAAQWSRGAAAGFGGFRMACRFGPATGVATQTSRCFMGMTASTAASTDVNPSSLLDMCGFGWDNGDTHMQFFTNDSVGVATKVDLGVNFPRPTADRTNMYEVTVGCLPNDTKVSYQIMDLTSGAVASGTVSADMPTNTAFLAPRGYMSVGGTSSVIGIAFSSLIVETDY